MDNFEPVPASFLPAKQNGQILLSPDGYQFRKGSQDKHNLYFICRNKLKYKCPATASVAKQGMILTNLRGTHSHDTEIMKKIAQKAVEEAIEDAKKNPTVTPRTLLSKVARELHANPATKLAIQSLPRPKTFNRRVERSRQKTLNCPPIPHNWYDMEIPDNLKVNSAGEAFIILEQTFADGRKAFGWCSPSCREVLNDSECWFGDGTFSCVDFTLFTQLFVITAKTGTGKTIPAAYFLLPNKENASYKAAFSSLAELGISGPKIFFADFELAIHKGFRDCYNAAKVVGCDVHFKRALRKNLGDHHLLSAYNNDARLQIFIRYLWSLSLIPPKDVVGAWTEFVIPSFPDDVDQEDWPNVTTEDVDDFLEYFEKNWIGRFIHP